MTGKSETYKQF